MDDSTRSPHLQPRSPARASGEQPGGASGEGARIARKASSDGAERENRGRKAFRADLHIHSCLSPCADIDCSPTTIARRARELGLHMIALTDHNAADNCPAFEIACRRDGLVPVFGCEITSAEEVHVLCLFENVAAATEMAALARHGMLRIPVNPKIYWPQYVVDADENILSQIDYLLTLASPLNLDEVRAACHSAGGLCIPAHIDRPANSLIAQLGFVPREDWDALEITLEETAAQPDCAGYALTCSSDAHAIENVGRRWIEFEAEDCSFEGLKRALQSWI